ncbi:MAG: M23 family metallopeptidase [Candidatus Handelsmanbacteria bacterium]|nr:M23 family metallopeptidase [Candidatus Handelsmanbacteria bacterium]
MFLFPAEDEPLRQRLMRRFFRSSSARFWLLASCLPALTVLRLGVIWQPASSPADLPAPLEPLALAPEPQRLTRTLGADDSIYQSLKRQPLEESQIAELIRAITPVFNLRSDSRPLDRYTLTLDPEGVVQRFEYLSQREPERPLVVERQVGRLVGRRELLPLEKRTEAIEVRIIDNLSNALADAGEGAELTDRIADEIFGSAIDFTQDLRRGDRLGIVCEKYYQNGRFIRYGEVLLARYTGEKVSQLGVSFQNGAGPKHYYDAQGNSLNRRFINYPLPFRGITSRFNTSRFHPILKKSRPHLGTDYAAGHGTMVWATASGRVVHAGWSGGYGNMVEIDHGNGYRSRYGHLSRVSVRQGQRVDQKTPVGLVGATGLATGPHLHYELIKNGRHLNPERANRDLQGEPLQKTLLAQYAAHRDQLLGLLAGSTHLAVHAGPAAGAVE